MRDTDHVPTTELAEMCREESERYQRGHSDHRGHCFELFRRAVVDSDQQAWAAVYEQYRRLVARWVDGSPHQVDEWVNWAFDKFWQAIAPKTFTQKFTGIGKVMAFLRACARSVRIDQHRRAEKHKLLVDLEIVGASTTDTTASRATDNVLLEELFDHIEERLRDVQERLVVHLSFRVGLMPRQIAEEYPDQFAGVAEVRRVKERVVLRLSTDPQLQEWWESPTRLGNTG